VTAEHVTLAALTGPRTHTRDVDIPGVGTITIRGVTRAEAFATRSATTEQDAEVQLIAAAVLHPALTVADAHRWCEVASAGEVEAVVRAILQESGLNPGAQNAAFPGNGEGRQH
jgi:hypothetical protein